MRSVGRAIGLDVHRDFCEVAISQDGEVRSSGRVDTTPERLELFGASLHPRDRVALEVSGSAWEVARILERHVARVVVVSPADTGIRQARAKTDRLDARTLARLLANALKAPRQHASGLEQQPRQRSACACDAPGGPPGCRQCRDAPIGRKPRRTDGRPPGGRATSAGRLPRS